MIPVGLEIGVGFNRHVAVLVSSSVRIVLSTVERNVLSCKAPRVGTHLYIGSEKS